MQTQTDGYVTDIPYTSQAYPALAPVNLLMAATLAGVHPPVLEPGAVVWELGCGHAGGLIAAAVAHPACHFFGVDFNPAHIAGARRRAADLGVTNVTLLDADFVDLAREPGALPGCDLAVIHGVYGWIGAPERAAVRALLRHGVRAGGLVYLSYNAMPGSAAMGIVQRALREAASLVTGRSDHRLRHGIERIKALRAAGALHLSGGGLMEGLFEKLDQADPAYLVHEYMNASWSALYHSDVARDMAEARLEYAGSAVPYENFPELMLTPAQAEALGEVSVPHVRETLRDLFISRILRKDLFMRGVRRMTEGERHHRLRETLMCAAVNPAEAADTLSVPAGEITLSPKFRAAAEALWEGGPQTLGALVDGPLAGATDTTLESAALLVSAGFAWPCLAPPPESAVATSRRALARGAAAVRAGGLGTRVTALAPRLGSAFELSGLECLVLDGLWQGVPDQTDALVEHVWGPFEAVGETLLNKGERIDDPTRCRALLADMVGRMRPDRLPIWRGLGMLPETVVRA
ncbi:class I SAM-dependent methyltransferase [Roseospira goensis]|uniref:SAM-dependent methyltransferase n=1 Tax=Roseospira goensis TaxID=391922 RepID=A0A7W6WKY4_9PROT|nr:class I SAM-dependent methyltransferase [Roseospira goensis]MBB4286259.1 SAM-dependent methyltransferase [Roseospira goensis]